MSLSPPLRIGSRGSPLALVQARLLQSALAQAWPELGPPGRIEIVVIRTTGDRITDRPLAELGGKGLFTKEIEEALLAGQVDLAVHSMKDVPTVLPAGLEIAAHLPREDPRDALIANGVATVAALPVGAVVGSSSLRRRAQLQALRPDLRLIDFRGNVDTRLKKLADGVADATLLALAGLRRLGFADRASAVLSADEMLPAVAQGAIGIEIRADDHRCRALLAPLDDPLTRDAVAVERAFLACLDGSCRTPIAGLARIDAEGRLDFQGLIAKPDGSAVLRVARDGTAAMAAAIGRDAGEELLKRAGPGFLGPALLR
jgi:hydroxymethylbilane synthase